MAGFYAAVVLYSRGWQQIAAAVGDSAPFPGAPAEWTADQRELWALHREYREMIAAVATWDGELPDPEVMENPVRFRRWFEAWAEDRKQGQDDRERNGFKIMDY